MTDVSTLYVCETVLTLAVMALAVIIVRWSGK
jgi:hypothetical protein